jgi:hypothetical protein
MGISYDGVYFFGTVSTDGGRDLNEETRAAMEAIDVDDTSDWFLKFFGLSWRGQKEAERLAIERWGCVFEVSYMGYSEYPVTVIHPRGARIWEWRGGRVPEWSQEQISFWRACVEKLRQDLPGLEEPGLWFGCSVG